MRTMSRVSIAPFVAALALAAPALAQQPPRQVAPPRVLDGQRLPTTPTPPPRPPVGDTDDPTAAVVIDGVKIDRAGYGEALIDEYGTAFLEPFVTNWLIERRAKELKVEVAPAEVEAQVEKQVKETLEKRFRGKEDAMKASLAQAGLTLEGWKSGLRKRLARDVLASAVVRADRDLSEAALRKEFEARYGAGGEKREGRVILCSTQVWASNLYTQDMWTKEKADLEKDAEARAKKLLADLKAGGDFAALAHERSEDPMAEKGGDYGRYWKNRFGAEADKALEALKIGEVSDAIATPRGFIVAKATGTQEGWEFKARHILLSTRLEGQADTALREKKVADAKAEAAKIVEALKKGEDFAKLARERSDDPGSKANGGDLGTFATGRMVAPFEQACLSLKDGEISGPVESPFGVHVIQLISKTRKAEDDAKIMSVALLSTEFLKVKERKLKGTLEEHAKGTANEVVAKLKAGEDAAELAKKFSDDSMTREKGGAIEEPLQAKLGQDVADAFRALAAPGDVTTFKNDRGYFVLKLEKLEKHSFEGERAALESDLRSKEPSAADVRAYREKLRAAAKVLKGKM
jgi:parvulin-like peptidyl-prolyl isomerase